MTMLTTLPNGSQLTKTGLVLPDGMTYQQWAAMAPQFLATQKAVQWALGDFINFGEAKWGKTYDEAQRLTGFDYSTLATYAWVARQIPLSLRRENLAYSIHKEVAGLPEEQQRAWLDVAEFEQLTVAEFRTRLRRYTAPTAPAAPVTSSSAAPLPAAALRNAEADQARQERAGASAGAAPAAPRYEPPAVIAQRMREDAESRRDVVMGTQPRYVDTKISLLPTSPEDEQDPDVPPLPCPAAAGGEGVVYLMKIGEEAHRALNALLADWNRKNPALRMGQAEFAAALFRREATRLGLEF